MTSTPGLRNWRTTLVGAMAAALNYLEGVGGKLPETRPEWVRFAVSVGLVVLSYLARDATMTSEQSGVSRSQANLRAIMDEEVKTGLRDSVDLDEHQRQLRKEAARKVLREIKPTDPAETIPNPRRKV